MIQERVATLEEIRAVARKDNQDAANLLLRLLQRHFPELELVTLELKKSKLSLNSLNGRASSAKSDYFFKMHTEEGEAVTLSDVEYYGADLLENEGLPVISPVQRVGTPGAQAVLYPYITAPTAFDFLESDDASGEMIDESERWKIYLRAERELVRHQLAVMLRSLQGTSPGAGVRRASLYQLFFNRLVSVNGESPRLDRFYRGRHVGVPGGGGIGWEDLTKRKWCINGRDYTRALGELIAAASTVLNPANPSLGASVIGHGDDHNGNKFLIDNRLFLFDPAFAGRQPALLSFIKATAHNVFLHPNWFYDPQSCSPRVSVSLAGDRIEIDHDVEISVAAPWRVKLLQLYCRELWIPLLDELKRQALLGPDWREIIKGALLCCALLTQNLFDSTRFPEPIRWLGLSRAVELGNVGFEECLRESRE